MALEYCAGSVSELDTRVALFEEYADATIEMLKKKQFDEDYYLQIHSIKSVAKGIGAYLLAGLSETIELRRNADFSKEVSLLIIAEYERVRKGITLYKKEIEET